MHSKRIPIPVIAAAAIPFVRALEPAIPLAQNGDFINAFKTFTHNLGGLMTGYYWQDNHWDMNAPLQTYVPIVIAIAAHKFLGPSINKYFDKIPMVGKYIGV